MSLLADQNLPFAVAIGVMLLLALSQVIGLGDFLDGADADLDFDADFDADGVSSGGFGSGIASLLGIGRMPLLVWLAVFLIVFAALGVSIQAFAENLTGAPLYPLLAAVFAGGAALPLTGMIARPIGRIMPQDETTAVNVSTLVGRRARILDGVARKGSPARAQVQDVHGQSHNVMVEPHEETSEFHQGETVLLVRREDQLFIAAALEDRRLAPA